jgi:hypothetical protein
MAEQITGCRCGRSTEHGHLCHWDAYSCESVGQRRFVVTKAPSHLPGRTTKAEGYWTVACDEHWAIWLELISP